MEMATWYMHNLRIESVNKWSRTLSVSLCCANLIAKQNIAMLHRAVVAFENLQSLKHIYDSH